MLRKLNLVVISCGLIVGSPLCMASDHAAASTKHVAAKPNAKLSNKSTEHKLKPSDLSVAQIIEKNIQARGGLKSWRAVQSMQMTGKMDAGYVKPKKELDPASSQLSRSLSRTGRIQAAIARSKEEKDPGKLVQVPFTMDLQRPRKQRLEVKYPDVTAVQIFDGEHGWKMRPFMGKNHEVEAYSAQELKLAQLQTELDGALIDYKAKGYKVEVEGMEPVAHKNAYRLKVTMRDGQSRHVWIDAKTFLDVQIDETRELGGKPRAVITALNNYKTVNGLKMPFEMETHVDGAKHTPPSKIIVDKITLNQKLDAAAFTKPN